MPFDLSFTSLSTGLEGATETLCALETLVLVGFVDARTILPGDNAVYWLATGD